MRHYHDNPGEYGPEEYVPFDGWRKAFDKEHICINTTEPPKPLIPLCNGYEYLVYDMGDQRLGVAIWFSHSGWEGECSCANPRQLVSCLPEVPDNPEEIK